MLFIDRIIGGGSTKRENKPEPYTDGLFKFSD